MPRDRAPRFWPGRFVMADQAETAAAQGYLTRPEVLSLCKVCGVRPKHVVANMVIVSPTGRAHFGEEGDSACGKSAEWWWWPL